MSQASIVVPTCDRPEYLELTLASLAGQSAPTSRFEVIVVNDGDASVDNAISSARALNPGLEITEIERTTKRNRAAARNAGMRAACGDICVFLDDDMIASSTLVENYLQSARDDVTVVQGDNHRIVFTFRYPFDDHTRARLRRSNKPALVALANAPPDRSRLVTPSQVFHRWSGLDDLADDEHPKDSTLSQLLTNFPDLVGLEMPWLLSATGNVAYPRVLIESIGGFDERFRGYGLEDLECGFRAHEHGARFTFSADCWARQQSAPREVASIRSQGLLNWRRFTSSHDRPSVWLWYAWRVLGWIDMPEYNALVRGCRLSDPASESRYRNLRIQLKSLKPDALPQRRPDPPLPKQKAVDSN